MEKLQNLEALIQEQEQKQRLKSGNDEPSPLLQSAISETRKDIKKAFGAQKAVRPAKLKMKVSA